MTDGWDRIDPKTGKVVCRDSQKATDTRMQRVAEARARANRAIAQNKDHDDKLIEKETEK